MAQTRESDIPEINELLDGRRLPVNEPMLPIVTESLKLAGAWGNPGRQHNQQLVNMQREQERADINKAQAALDKRKRELAEASAADIDAYKNMVKRIDMLQSGALDDSDLSDDDDSDGDSDESDANVPPRPRRTCEKSEKMASKPRPLHLRAVQPMPANPHNDEADWSGLHKLMRVGLKNAAIPKDRYSSKAYTHMVPEMEEPSPNGDTFTLRPHQREAIGWWQHTTQELRCFLLSDDMGLGKTSTAVARIKIELDKATLEGDKKQFLLVVPLSLIPAWEKELSRCPSIKLCSYLTGEERSYKKAELVKYDVILTTFDIVRDQYLSLKYVQRDFRDTQLGYKNLLERKMREEFYAQPGNGRSEAETLRESRVDAPLLSIDFFELIVDEVHIIKGRHTFRGEALRHINAINRVGLSATPCQNSFWDLFSLFRFFRLEPLDREAFFRSCFINPATKRGLLFKSVNADSVLVLTSILAAIQLRRSIYANFEGEPLTGVQEWHGIYHSITMNDAAQALQMDTEDLWDEERRQEKRREEAKKSEEASHELDDVEKLKHGKLSKKENGLIFKKILDARLNCIHPLLGTARYGESGETELEGRKYIGHASSSLRGPSDVEQGYNTIAQAQVEASDYSLMEVDSDQPELDHQKLQWEKNRKDFCARIRQSGWETDKTIPIILKIQSTMVATLKHAETIANDFERKEYLARNKIVVFSEYLAALDIVDIAIQQRSDIKPLRFDGSCSEAEKKRAVERFEEVHRDFHNPASEPDEIPILLATIKGVEGLTLVHARHVMFVEPGWNPFNLERAIGRVVRIGQRGQVIVHRFIADRSIELKLLDLESVKRDQASAVQDEEKLLAAMDRVSGWREEDMERVLQQGAGTARQLGL